MKRLKSLIPMRVRSSISAVVSPGRSEWLASFEGKRKVFVGLAGFYQNLGDIAITQAQIDFLKETLPDFEVVPVASHETYGLSRQLKGLFQDGDILTLIGGGNMGDLYQSLEDARLHLLRLLPNAPTVAFPQSWSFTDSMLGREAVTRSARTYGKHQRLTLFARETVSLGRMRSAFPTCSVELAPDIVLSLRWDSVVSRERAGTVLMLRDDAEGVLGDDMRRALADDAGRATLLDTVDVPLEDCTRERYRGALDRFLSRVAEHRVSLTDRLHGMIFSVLTRTPSVTLPNSTGKTAAIYSDWLHGTRSVRFVQNPTTGAVREALAEQEQLNPNDLVVPDLSSEFAPLRQALLDAANG